MPNSFWNEFDGNAKQKPGKNQAFWHEFDGGNAGVLTQNKPSPEESTQGNFASRALSRGLHQFGGMAAGGAAMTAGLLEKAGIPQSITADPKEYWMDVARSQDRKAAQYPGMEFTDIRGPVSAGQWVVEKVIETAPYMLATFGTAGLASIAGSRVGGAVLARTLANRAVVGTTAFLEGGGNYAELRDRGIDNPVSSMATGVASGYIELLGGNIRVFDKILGAEKSGILTRAVDRMRNSLGSGKSIQKGDIGIVRRIVNQIREQAPEEAVQEALQEISSLSNIAYNDPTFEAYSMDTFKRVGEAAAAGAAVGGVMAAPQAFITENKGPSVNDLPDAETPEQKLGRTLRVQDALAGKLSKQDVSQLYYDEKDPSVKKQLHEKLMEIDRINLVKAKKALEIKVKQSEEPVTTTPVVTKKPAVPEVSMADLEAQYDAAQTEEERAAASRAMIDLEKQELAKLDEEILRERQAEEEPVSEETPRQSFESMQARQNLTPDLEEMQSEPVSTPGLYELMGEPINDTQRERRIPRIQPRPQEAPGGAVPDQGRGAETVKPSGSVQEETREEIGKIYRKPDDAPYPNKLSTNARKKALEREGVITEPVEVDGGWALREVSRKEPETVEPWKQTLKEYQENHSGDFTDLMDEHMEAVEKAVSSGKDVPAKVLHDYPTIQQKAEAMKASMPKPKGPKEETLPALKENLEKLKEKYGKAVRALPIGSVGGDETTQKLADDMRILENKIGKLEKPQKDAQIAEEQRRREEQNKKQRERLEEQLKTAKVFRKVNGWDIIKLNNNFYVVDPNTKEEIYYSSQFSRAKEVANESKPETQPLSANSAPVKIGTGDLVKSKSGRILSPVPKVDATSNRKTINTIYRINEWLLKEAKIEAENNNDEFVQMLLKAIKLKNISQADQDMMNLYLFDDVNGPSQIEPTVKENLTVEPEFVYKPPEGTQEKYRAVLYRNPYKENDQPKWMIYDVDSNSYFGSTTGKPLTKQDAINIADKRNIDYQKDRERINEEKSKYPDVFGTSTYLRQLTGYTAQSKFLGKSKEVGYIEQAYDKKLTVYYHRGDGSAKNKLVVISEPSGSKNISSVYEINPSEYGDKFHWLQGKDVSSIEKKFKVNSPEKNQIKRIGTASKGNVSVKIVEHPRRTNKQETPSTEKKDWGVELTENGMRLQPFEEPMTLEDAQDLAVRLLTNPKERSWVKTPNKNSSTKNPKPGDVFVSNENGTNISRYVVSVEGDTVNTLSGTYNEQSGDFLVDIGNFAKGTISKGAIEKNFVTIKEWNDLLEFQSYRNNASDEVAKLNIPEDREYQERIVKAKTKKEVDKIVEEAKSKETQLDENEKQQSIDRANSLQPITSLKLTQGKVFWEGNVVEESSNYVSNGKIAIDLRHVKKGKENRLKQWNNQRDKDKPYPDDFTKKLFDNAAEYGKSTELSIMGWTDTPEVESTDRTAYFDRGDGYVPVNANYLKTIMVSVDYDNIIQGDDYIKKSTWGNKDSGETPILFMKGDKITAILMPFQLTQDNKTYGPMMAIDYETAKKKMAPRFATQPQESFKGQPGGFGSVSLETLQRWVDSVQDQFSIPINAIQSASGLPGRYQDAAMAAMKSEDGKKFVISGMYEPLFDEIYIIADGIRDRAHFEETIIHEGVGHAGFRRVFGPDYKKYLQKIADSPDFQDEIYEYAVKKRYDIITAADEWFANHVEKETLDRSLWRRFVDMVRRVLRRMGFKSYVWNLNKPEFSKKDLKELVRRSREAVMSEGRYSGLEEQPAFSQRDPGPVYYSQMERTLADKLPGKGTKESYREMVRNWAKKGEIKEEELEWSGLLGTEGSPLYGNGSDKVSKQEIMDWLDGEKVEIEEIRKGDYEFTNKNIKYEFVESPGDEENSFWISIKNSDDPRDSVLIVNKQEGEYNVYDGIDSEYLRWFETSEEAILYAKKIISDRKQDDSYEPKYDKWQVPGGENYREVLLTLPIERGQTAKDRNRYQELSDIGESRDFTKEEQKEFDIISARLEGKHNPYLGEKETYRSSHWEEPNVLAHVRLNDRVDADGKKVLFVEEIQSDWHQAGRKEGYAQSEKQLRERQEELAYKQNRTKEEQSELDRIFAILGSGQKELAGVPNAPFKKTWPLLAMKRIIRMAAEGGYDRIAWTNGEQQAERYDLSKQIDRISLTKRSDKFDVNGIYDKNNKNIYKDLNIPANEEGARHLENIVGKELSTKIINDAVNKKDREGWSYSGLDLKVGGEGMIGFYDTMLPSIVNKYVKKWGAKVGETTINTKQGVGDSTENFVVVMPDGKERRLPVRDYAQAKRLAEKWGGKLKGAGETVHSFDVTPDMQQAALAGQPLFKKTQVEENPSNQIVLDPETFFQKFSRNVQDKLNRIMTMQETVFGNGKDVPDEYDVYGSARFLMGKIRTSIENFYNRFVKDKDSFLNRMTEAGISIEDMNHYLVAKRFPYYMRMVLRNNPKRDLSVDPLFMTEDEADDIVATFEAKDPNYKKFGREIWQAYKDDLQAKYDSGLISKDEQDRLNREDPYHVAFKSDPSKKGKQNYHRTGKGLSITRKEFYKPMGRKDYPDNSIAQLIVDHHESVLRSEKNKITERLWKLWDDYGDQLKTSDGNELFTVKKQQYRPRYDKNGEISYMEPVITDAEREGVVVIHKRNELAKNPESKQMEEKNFIYTITINDRALAESMKNLGVSRAIPYISQINQLLRNTAITLNPEFVFMTNMMRDLQTAAIHISGEHGDKMNVKIMKDVPAAIRGIWRGLRGKTPTEMTKWYKRAADLGVPTGWGKQKNNAEILRDMTAVVNRFNKTGNKIWETLESMYGFMEDMNESVELGVRVSTFKNLVESGVAEKKAALYAKNLTVDFDLKGNWGTVINSLYLFSNAGIQGTWRIWSAAYHSKKVRGIVTGMVAASLLQSMWNRAVDPDEWDKVSDYDKDNHWLFMIPGTGKMISIKVPYGYNLPVVVGRVLDDYRAGRIGETKAFTRVLDAANDAFNPIGGGSFFQLLSPSFLDPVVQIAENKNFFGGPIHREQSQFGAKKPGSQMYFDSVRPWTKEFTDWLNSLKLWKEHGGNERVSGVIDINPENIDHVIDTVLGGSGKFVANAVNTGRAVIDGEELDVKQVPLVRQVIKTGSEWTIPKIVREMVDESGRTVYSEHERELFSQYLIKAVRSGEIKPDYAKRMRTEFFRNQIKAQA